MEIIGDAPIGQSICDAMPPNTMSAAKSVKPRCLHCQQLLNRLSSKVKVEGYPKAPIRQVGFACWGCNFIWVQNPYSKEITAVKKNMAEPISNWESILRSE